MFEHKPGIDGDANSTAASHVFWTSHRRAESGKNHPKILRAKAATQSDGYRSRWQRWCWLVFPHGKAISICTGPIKTIYSTSKKHCEHLSPRTHQCLDQKLRCVSFESPVASASWWSDSSRSALEIAWLDVHKVATLTTIDSCVCFEQWYYQWYPPNWMAGASKQNRLF